MDGLMSCHVVGYNSIQLEIPISFCKFVRYFSLFYLWVSPIPCWVWNSWPHFPSVSLLKEAQFELKLIWHLKSKSKLLSTLALRDIRVANIVAHLAPILSPSLCLHSLVPVWLCRGFNPSPLLISHKKAKKNERE